MYGWVRADPICSLILSVIIFMSIKPLLLSTAGVLLQRTPKKIEKNINAAYDQISRIQGVLGLTESHFWANTSKHFVGSVQVQILYDANEQKVLREIQEVFKRYKVKNLTVQLNKEIGAGAPTSPTVL
eukprot:TRINITY_DN766_c0_g1_i3.p2 TRINITY_DN766_c0_g1~~TRINITY_DN766_c0_g1_i3.p2  ORF type:complete len:128 (+),score=17.38 TRINITY_DN766_c0_g1_i3:815-1198(+)